MLEKLVEERITFGINFFPDELLPAHRVLWVLFHADPHYLKSDTGKAGEWNEAITALYSAALNAYPERFK